MKTIAMPCLLGSDDERPKLLAKVIDLRFGSFLTVGFDD